MKKEFFAILIGLMLLIPSIALADGEITSEDFEKYNELQEKAGRKIAANPRNLAAGSLRQLDPAITRERGLKMFVFNVQQGPEEFVKSHCKSMDILNQKDVPVVFHRRCVNAE